MTILESINNISKLPQSANTVIILGIIILMGLLVQKFTSHFILKLADKFVTKTENKWDDIFFSKGLFRRIALLAPVIVVYFLSANVFDPQGTILRTIESITHVYLIIVMTLISFAFLNSINEIYSSFKVSIATPIKSFLQIIKIIIFIIASIFTISSLIDQSPWALLKAMGALTAVSMLVFKDSILGFVATIQLAGQKMVHIGDWIEMPSFGADGDVIDISLNTVKVQNWDKTISNIPTYALVSNSFKNWRGMSESGGRRIKRSFNMDINSFKFCTEEMTDKFTKFEFIENYIKERNVEVEKHNEKNCVNTEFPVNGRRMTNIGTFRYYIKQYLRSNSKINMNMTFLVRQLAPTDHGLPIEVYIFSKDTAWVNYEEIQADIFDHILTVIPEFDLRIFQNPSGRDFSNLINR